LFAALAIAYVIPASALLPLGTAAQWAGGGLMVALPILFAALIFSTLLSRRGDASRALAYNLLGAILGGVLEYSAMALGVKAMYLVAGALYAGAAFYATREERVLARDESTEPNRREPVMHQKPSRLTPAPGSNPTAPANATVSS
jgi:hypothetical protein